ncbi:MAG: hypothetical protein ACKOW9_04855 [Candidatus Paceibacterota bacterium]
MRKKSLVLTLVALSVLTGCSDAERDNQSPVKRVLFDVDAYTGYGPNVVKVQRGISEAETAISKGVKNGVKTKDMNFDYFNEEMPRSSTFPGEMLLHTVGGGLQPILSVQEGDPVIVAINDSDGYCYYLKAKADGKKVTFYRGLAINPNCRANPVSKYVTWSTPNNPDFPTLEDLTIPPEFISNQPQAGNGSMPNNSMPNNSMPNNSMPNNSMPSNSMPSNSMPSNTSPSNRDN